VIVLLMLFYAFLITSSLLFGPENNIKQTNPESAVSHCKELPASFNWLGKKYVLVLRSTDTHLEPGMKLGFMKCKNGQMKTFNDDYNSITVFDAFSTDVKDDVLILYNGQRLLYVPY
jgi:hypothetical protein